MNYILLTSCFRPVLLSNVTNTDVITNVRLSYKCLCSFLSSSLCSSREFKVIFLDCSDFEQIEPSVLETIDSLFVHNPLLQFHRINFTASELNAIQLKGKGFSEMLMIKHFLGTNSFPSGTKFLKCSARYTPLFEPSCIFPFIVDCDNSFSVSHVFKRAICHSYLADVLFLNDFIDYSLERLDDSSGVFLEFIAYEFIASVDRSCLHKFRRSFFYPFYDPKVLPGSSLTRRFSSSLLFQLLRFLACLF